MKSLVEARLKRARALELVAQGKAYDQIAGEVGYSHRGSAHRAVSWCAGQTVNSRAQPVLTLDAYGRAPTAVRPAGVTRLSRRVLSGTRAGPRWVFPARSDQSQSSPSASTKSVASS